MKEKSIHPTVSQDLLRITKQHNVWECVDINKIIQEVDEYTSYFMNFFDNQSNKILHIPSEQLLNVISNIPIKDNK